MRRVKLPEDSRRGGILTHASVLKVTSNGTVTSPVRRGVFVLSRLLGQAPRPPPADIGSIEPDTRGATTIRETLRAHRDLDSCASCHRFIDPPGFALESFDPIGGFRTRYRSTEKGSRPARRPVLNSAERRITFRDGPRVDSSGALASGESFAGIRAFKKLLLGQEEQVARHFISQLIVYATGGEIQFADRDEVNRLVRETREQSYPMRTILHKVVQNDVFRNK